MSDQNSQQSAQEQAQQAQQVEPVRAPTDQEILAQFNIDPQAIINWSTWLHEQMPRFRAHQQQMAQALANAMVIPGQSVIPGANYGVDTGRGLTVFLFGPIGTWKTSWAAQWPAPFFISIAAEGGDDALPFYPKIALNNLTRSQKAGDDLTVPPVFNVARPPSIEVKTINQFNQWIDKAARTFRAAGICTVVVDSVTYLIDMWISEHTAARRGNSNWKQANKDGKVDMMRPGDWGMLEMFIKEARVKLANSGLNVIWTSLSKDIKETDESNQAKQTVRWIKPRVQGAAGDTLPGACKLVIQAERELVAEMGFEKVGRSRVVPVYQVTPSQQAQDIRHKYADAFSAGKLVDPYLQTEPTFRAIWRELAPFVYLGT